MGAHARCYPTDIRLRHLRQVGRPRLVFRGRIRFAFATARIFAFQGFDVRVTPSHRLVSYMSNEQLHGHLLAGDKVS